VDDLGAHTLHKRAIKSTRVKKGRPSKADPKRMSIRLSAATYYFFISFRGRSVSRRARAVPLLPVPAVAAAQTDNSAYRAVEAPTRVRGAPRQLEVWSGVL
jgi:hypothetical protein